MPGHVCEVNGDLRAHRRDLEYGFFIQYNRTSPADFQPLPKLHVDTGMGFERIVSIIQGRCAAITKPTCSSPCWMKPSGSPGRVTRKRAANLTTLPGDVLTTCGQPLFLIADGVIPGNVGRNYVCRMIIRRAARFARKLNLTEPFMAQVARLVIENYRSAYPELTANAELIYETLTAEEQRFAETLDAGFAELQSLVARLKSSGESQLDGKTAFNLYSTLGFPLEITRDILEEEWAHG